ncbi:MAG: hypothetical protein Q8O26_19495 [Phreatobacter sp.]|uniref:hypothetical protein n=1 Tax=Phreatobacter sp. TaxID=1966341 RepID=UPI0027363BCC|nr:hypothetical protein [Phreatobacter sp.]MDP2804061.1 hypothetical protein [Phreatobacter sp.]
MSTRPKLSLCVPVWGRSHVATWLDHVLPSWFSPGNLPALAARCDLAVVLLTRGCDAEEIAAHPAGARLIASHAVTIGAIEDLVTGTMSAVTLTLAFVRGARMAQARGPGTMAAFLNADFILADGSLAALAAVVPEADIVLAPSLRTDSDAVLARLPAADPDGAMPLAAPRLAGLALAHPHPTAQACFVDQDALTSEGAYEFYHHAGPGLVISRSMQLFPLAVRPGPEPLVAEAFCDYGLFDLWAPAARIVTLSDSADWFALELGDPAQQASFIRPGPHDPAAITAGLAQWSTAPQRAQADTLVTIRSGPAETQPEAGAVAALDRFIAAVTGPLPPPLLIRQHPYWRTGLRRWREAAEAARLPPPAELAGWTEAPLRRGERLREALRRLLYGRAGRRWPWQIDARLERDLTDLRRHPVAVDDSRLWLARHAGLTGPAVDGTNDHLVRCGAVNDPGLTANLPAGLQRLDLILTASSTAAAPDRAALATALAAELPDWRIAAVTALGRRADEARRDDLERLGRLVWARAWGPLLALAPRVVGRALLSAMSVLTGRPVAWQDGQAFRITATREPPS